LYNGTVKEIPNTMNQNYFFDNLNYNQRQKVWATKVPRYGEIWWYYPRGNATECTDAIIYNVRENTWYDAGEALGARRSAGYFSQVFRFPVAAGWEISDPSAVFTGSFALVSGSPNLNSMTYYPDAALGQAITGTGVPLGTVVNSISTNGINTLTSLVGGSGYPNAVYTNVPLTGGSGFQAKATVTVAGNTVTTVVITDVGVNYAIGDVLSASNINLGGAGSGFSINVATVFLQIIVMSQNATSTGTQTLTFGVPANLISIYQHEIGTDEVKGQVQNAIESYFETNDLGWVSGGPSQPTPVGENFWLHLERLEPDFIQSGQMELYITGRPYAQSTDETTGPYTFQPGTNKIDLREQRRELRLKFRSNVQGGNFQLGRIIVNADAGDVRGY
jgi:hypothetical protein